MRQDRQGGYFETIVGEHGVDVRTAMVAIGGEGHRIELFEYRSPRAGSVAPRSADVGFATSAWPATTSTRVLARLLAAGGERGLASRSRSTRGVNAGGRAVYVRDPDGHTVELFTPPPAA